MWRSGMALNGGVSEFSVRKWRKKFEIREDFERRMGCTVYSLLPGVVENTFGRELGCGCFWPA